MRRRRLALAVLASAASAGGAAARERRPAAAEDRIGQGWAVMNSDPVLVGPGADPARVSGLRDAVEALRRIAETRSPFVSRGDRGRAHETELRLWRAAGIDPSQGRGRWYREANGCGDAALAAAAAQGGYALVERGVWLAARGPRDLRIMVEGDRRLSE